MGITYAQENYIEAKAIMEVILVPYNGFFAVNGDWSVPVESAPCSVTCGTGMKSSLRYCNNPSPQNGGLDCEGESVINETCTMDDCPGK